MAAQTKSRPKAKRKRGAAPEKGEAAKVKFLEEAPLEEHLAAIGDAMSKLDSISSTIVNRDNLPTMSGRKIASLVRKLEQLAGLTEAPSQRASIPAGEDGGTGGEGSLAEQVLASARASKDLEELSGAEKQLAEQLQSHLDVGVRVLDAGKAKGSASPAAWPPPAPLGDPSPEALRGRVPALAGLEEVQKDARGGLGSSELGPYSTRCRSCSLQSLLQGSQTKVLWSSGDPGLVVSGVTDEPSLVGSGDLLVVTWEGLELAREVAARAWQSGAAAVAFCGEDASGDGLEADRVLGGGGGAVAILSDVDAAGKLARAFFGDPAARLQIALVAGSTAVEVRTASWLLCCILEAQHGARRTALLSSRRTLVGHRALDLDRALTACAVQELLADMVDSGVGVCVAEALPGALQQGAFQGVEFCCAVDLDAAPAGRRAARGGAAAVRELLRQASSARPVLTDAAQGDSSSRSPRASGSPRAFVLRALTRRVWLPKRLAVAPKAQVREILRWRGHPADLSTAESSSLMLKLQGFDELHEYLAKTPKMAYLQELEEMKVYKMKRAPLVSSLAERGVEVDATMKIPRLREMLAELINAEIEKLKELTETRPKDEEEEEEEVEPGVLQGAVVSGSTPWRLQLRLATSEAPALQVSLPLMGIAGARAATAACSMGLAMARLTPVNGSKAPSAADLLRQVSSAMEAAPPPPGAMELLVAGPGGSGGEGPGELPRVVVVLHDAGTAPNAREVREVLRAARAWMGLQGEEAPPGKLTAVFGCPGEMMRGERAKCGWALADLCDTVVLTSSQPRNEPPMQILEDILDAMRARVPGTQLGQRSAMRLCSELEEVHVVADRVDAIKLATTANRPFYPQESQSTSVNFVVVFGQAHQDTQEVPDREGTVRRWLCNDRRVILEALDQAARLEAAAAADASSAGRIRSLNIGQVPWGQCKTKAKPVRQNKLLQLPGRSLHWTYEQTVYADGAVRVPL